MRLTGLWRHPDFLKLWTGQTVSMFGSEVTRLAMPLTAVLVLGATPRQMGFIGALMFAPYLLIGLIAGVWVDRMRRRPILIGADLGRAAVIGSIPAAAALDVLRIEQLYVVAFVNGTLAIFFDVAYQSFLPSLVRREQLVEGNSKLETSRSSAQVAGPSMAGALVQLLTATTAIVIDAVSFLVSAVFVSLIRVTEPPNTSQTGRRSVWREIGEGMRAVASNRLLRAVAVCTGLINLGFSMLQSVFVIYLTREVGLAPSTLGLVFAAGGAGALGGALFAANLARRLGMGRVIIAGALMIGAGLLSLPLIHGPKGLVVVLLAVAWAVPGLGSMLFNINQVSLRQAITPPRLQGRVNATMRTIMLGIIPVGALTGGFLGGTIGLRPTMFVATAVPMCGVLWLLLSPVRTVREPPAPAAEMPPVPAPAR